MFLNTFELSDTCMDNLTQDYSQTLILQKN